LRVVVLGGDSLGGSKQRAMAGVLFVFPLNPTSSFGPLIDDAFRLQIAATFVLTVLLALETAAITRFPFFSQSPEKTHSPSTRMFRKHGVFLIPHCREKVARSDE
jgi:hypothetical protein